MPYIKKEDREIVDEFLRNVLFSITDHIRDSKDPMPIGWYNYIISKVIHQFLLTQGLNYTNINAAIGVLECAKLELYRMIATPYEDIKITENGYISCVDSKLAQPEKFKIMIDDPTKEDE